MGVDFQVSSLRASEFSDLFIMTAEQLQSHGISVKNVEKKPGYPCRISLKDAEIGEKVLLLSYAHHQVNGGYRASGPIFIRMGAVDRQYEKNSLPLMLKQRQLSVRAYDQQGFMIATRVVQGSVLAKTITDLFSDTLVAYLQVHNAGPGCFNCQINRYVP